METQDLHTASDYINNLLLARGLLRNGKPIDFAPPADASDRTDATMSRIINLLHDLVLRRDREADQRENLATTIRSLRSTEAKQTHQIEQLQTKTTELSRSLAIAEGQERAFKATLRNAEATSKGLKEQVQRMKASIQQIRAQCATDIRKRDIEMQKLKAHLTDRQRGKRDGVGVTTITITPTPKLGLRRPLDGGDGVSSPGYSLRQESTEFLTHLCQTLSDENDVLISIVQSSIQTLRSLQGLPDPDSQDTELTDETGDNGHIPHDSVLQASESSAPYYETLSSQMGAVLDQLGLLLTNPSFVPLEEVEIRDNEIHRLREGWEKMEERWREAVAMMDGWHKRIAEGGDSVNIDELKQGIGLGLDTPPITGTDDTVPAALVNNTALHKQSGRDETDSVSREETPADSRRKLRRRDAKHLDIPLGERSGNARPSPRREEEMSIDNGPESFEASVDELVVVDEPSRSKIHRRHSKRIVESRNPKQPSKSRSNITLAEKLAIVESEARHAQEERQMNESKKRSSSSRETKQRPRRRKSTLTPAELEGLIGSAS
ncbi:hypothetical protein AJ80_05879 [Polytolypa hystricis UAMH7299]|uniref:NIMA interactive protein n=1 Tax=Polytolypa hystricis (strain UAMH7299) TaxID=1447883 RepID=A0A2B7Y062_POLH7|nr:hypothetical protein AJ80_05879 [Polytolypa hystricis UAMH7299]